MGAVIEANRVEFESYTTHELVATKLGAMDFSVLAAEKCILEAGVDKDDIDLLI